MKNIDIQTTKDKLIITVDLTKRFGPSKSGKTTIIASTEGNIAIDQKVSIGVNVYEKRI